MDDDKDHDEIYQNAVDEWDFVEGQAGVQLQTLQHGDTYSRVLSDRIISDFIQIVEGPRCAAIFKASELPLLSRLTRYIFGPPFLNQRCRNKLQSVLSLTKLPLAKLPEETQYEVLGSLYENMTEESCPRRFGSHWQKIGFQGNDPATDLRGVGVFGLWLLLRLSEDPVAKAAFPHCSMSFKSCEESYPFSVCMITLCRTTMTIAKEGFLNKYIDEETIDDVTFRLFRELFKAFNCEFENSEQKGVIAAGEIIRKIDKNPRKYVRLSSI
ncbi:unnamed protein product [Oikopleura dioica]|uniref:ELMO domain-containing protein n=1 Tax=Oikopleura dioica TaxID=34765 RepID=E4XTE3_OIKDI|nr:unnamed protein product [Oikopleura dioica]